MFSVENLGKYINTQYK